MLFRQTQRISWLHFDASADCSNTCKFCQLSSAVIALPWNMYNAECIYALGIGGPCHLSLSLSVHDTIVTLCLSRCYCCTTRDACYSICPSNGDLSRWAIVLICAPLAVMTELLFEIVLYTNSSSRINRTRYLAFVMVNGAEIVKKKVRRNVGYNGFGLSMMISFIKGFTCSFRYIGWSHSRFKVYITVQTLCISYSFFRRLLLLFDATSRFQGF